MRLVVSNFCQIILEISKRVCIGSLHDAPHVWDGVGKKVASLHYVFFITLAKSDKRLANRA